jgi:hypothetical protein
MRQISALPDLAARINAEHQACLGSVRTALGHAMACGELLEQVKRSGQLKHGQWLAWIKTKLEFSDRTAQVYMRLWKHREKIERRLRSNPQTTADLTIEAAEQLLALSTGMSRTGSGLHNSDEFRARYRIGERIKQNRHCPDSIVRFGNWRR